LKTTVLAVAPSKALQHDMYSMQAKALSHAGCLHLLASTHPRLKG
jgi:hypothetical protein